MKTTEIETPRGVWKVLIKGEEVLIADDQGRSRYRGIGHDMTAVHLAMQMAQRPMPSEPNLDQALRMEVEEFLKHD